jgi:hypothetical protein
MCLAFIHIIFFSHLIHLAASLSYFVDSSKLQKGDGTLSSPYNNLDDALEMASYDNDASRTIIIKSNLEAYKISTSRIFNKSLVVKFEGSYLSDQATIFFNDFSGFIVRKTFLTFENIIFNQIFQTFGAPILLQLEEEASLNFEVLLLYISLLPSPY